MMLALRLAAIALVVVALIDPVWTVSRPRPVPIEMRLPPSGSPASADAAAISERLLQEAAGRFGEARGEAPDAIVLIGPARADRLPPGVPVSSVALSAGAPRNVRIEAVTVPPRVVAGQAARIEAAIEGRGVQGQNSTVVLEHAGVVLAQAAHEWRAGRERAEVSLTFVPPGPGFFPLRVHARTLDGESPAWDNVADVAVRAGAQPLRVLAYEPRPTWAAAFVRRAVEADPAFAVDSSIAFSEGLEARGGEAPRSLTAEALRRYDVVLAGAPEVLNAGDLQALDVFVRRRGGTVVFLPDRRPSGAYTRMVPGAGFDELLLEHRAALDTAGPHLSASELALVREPATGIAALATVKHEGRQAVVIGTWPRGAGRVVFSGALDAWRFRARDDGGFARFWTGAIAGFALASPPPVSLDVTPSIAAPGSEVTVRVTLRETEYDGGPNGMVLPPVAATVLDARGAERPVRLWPTAEIGRFEGTLNAPASGRYTIRAGDAEAPLLVEHGVHAATGESEARNARLARASGGVVATREQTDMIVQHLASLVPENTTVPFRPARSGWWFWAVAVLASTEWMLRRRRGLS